MATEVKHAIRTPAGWSANQAAMEALYGVDGYYTLLSLWEDDIPPDISSATGIDEQWIAECYNDWPSGLNDVVVIADRVTDTANNIVITSAGADGTEGQSRHDGTPKSGFYLWSATSFTNILTCGNNDVIVDGVEVDHNAQGGAIVLGATDTAQNCIVRNGGDSGSRMAINIIESGGTIINTLCYDSARGMGSIGSYRGMNLFNCTAVDCTVFGFQIFGSGGSKIHINNCIAFNCAIDFQSVENIDESSSNNATSASTIDSSLGTLTDVDASDFESTVGDDFHLSETSQLRGAGLNLIENPPSWSSPQYDVDGDQWPDTGAWDIGFDYFVGSGGSGIDVDIPKSDINLTSFQPVVNISQHITAEIPQHDISLLSHIPSVTIGANIDVIAPQHDISINSYPPAVVTSNNISLDIPVHDINLLSYAPSIVTSESIDLYIPLHNININSHAPIVVASNFIDAEIPDHNININSHAPVINLGAIIENIIPAHNISITGYAPDVAISEHINSIIPEHDISLLSYAPDVLANSSVNAIIPKNDITITSHIPRVLIAGAFTTAKERIYGYPAINRIYTMTRR